MLNGEVRGVYVVDKGVEDYDENSLDSLEGKFKVNVYVSLAPEAILRGVMSESA